MNRRRVLTSAAVVLALLAGLGAVAWVDTTQLVVGRNAVAVPGLPTRLRILHVADLHAARFGSHQSAIESAISGATFDAAVITGDLLVLQGGDRTAAFDLVDVLLRHTHVVLYVRGNHDDAALADELAARGATVVRPGEVVRFGTGDARVAVVAADSDGRVDARLAVATPLLLVAMHQPPGPVALARMRKLTSGPQVVLAGHTHAGQVRLPLVGAVWAPLRWGPDPLDYTAADEWFPELRGIQVTGVRSSGSQVVEVTPGLGTTTVPVRLFDPAELTVLTLTPER